MYKILNIANFHAFHVWWKHILSCNDTVFFLHFLPFFACATQVFSTPVTPSNLCNQAPLFTELRLLQGTQESMVQRGSTMILNKSDIVLHNNDKFLPMLGLNFVPTQTGQRQLKIANDKVLKKN